MNLTNILKILVHLNQKISLIQRCHLKVFWKGSILPAHSIFIYKWIQRCLFFSETNKSPGGDEINFNVIKHCFGELCGPLEYLFDSSLQSGIFPELMKVAIISSAVFKTGDTADISNYRTSNVQSWTLNE